ncbi:hypothetical protein OU995_17710 [Roseateles sp. SL47]|uniref:hypothetical protein n=1 Tax=Roseateles sp. SL47 TaxID=2995138 RepID=UPI00226F985D|nr:hypothetical protein [Roseateles sp. SL47]WAC71412.1 hypothetical protein OU995_17710 [Roseateles sp. SL47]
MASVPAQADMASADALPPRGTTFGDRGLCKADETVYFACPTTKSRWISLCGAPGALQYRFGRTTKIELAFPDQASDGPSQFRYADYFRQQVTRTEVSFEREGADYAVYVYQEGNQRTAGVRVTTREGKEVDVACQGPVLSQLGQLQSAIPCDRESALTGGECGR